MKQLVPTFEKAAETFGVGRASGSRWLRQHGETGSLTPREVGGNRPRAVHDARLVDHCMSHPEALLRERVEARGACSGEAVHVSTMSLAMRRIGWTHKKRTPTARERRGTDVVEKVKAFSELQSGLDPICQHD